MRIPFIIKINWKLYGKYGAFNIFMFTFIHKDVFKNEYTLARTINHETIHYRQFLEFGIILFPFAYLIAGIINQIKRKDGYTYNPFEEEAYDNDGNLDYLQTRKPYAWIKYIGKTHQINYK